MKNSNESNREHYERLSKNTYIENGSVKWGRSIGTVKKGDIAGSPDADGYLRIGSRIRGTYRKIFAHRLSWFKEYGTLPTNIIDHKDHDILNNDPSNLRDSGENNSNQHRKKSNSRNGRPCKFKYKGLSSCSRTDKILVFIYVNKKRIYGGSFNCEIEAAKRYDQLAKEHHKEFAVLNFPE